MVDYLAEEELKAAEKFVMQAFDVKPARQCSPVRDRKDARKARKVGKHERMAKLLNKLVEVESAPTVDLLSVLGD